MKKIFLFLLLIFPMMASAQVITYDTIRVSPDDERNIHRTQQQTTQTEQSSRVLSNRPVLLDRGAESGFKFDKRKMRFGANLGLSLSRNYTVLVLGPQVGYQFSNYFMAGAGVKYYYNKVRAYQLNEEYLYKNHLLGTNVFGYAYPASFIAVFAQPEINYLWSTYRKEGSVDDPRKTNGWVPSMLVGAGLRLGRSHITLNYDLAQQTNSPYPKGVFLGVSAFF